MLAETLISLVLVGAIIYLAIQQKKEWILATLTLPLILLLIMFGINGEAKLFLTVMPIVAIIIYPVCFLIKKVNKNTALLIYLTLLIEWDWAITWQYVQRHSTIELNLLLDTSNFLIFTIQKLSPLILFIIMYFIARKDKKLIGILDWGIATVSSFYFLLFLWTLYVISVVNAQILTYLIFAVIAMIAVLIFILISKHYRHKKHS